MSFETIQAIAFTSSILAAVVSLSAVVLSRRETRQAPPGRNVTITIEDPATGLVRTVMRSTRRLDQIRRDVERALRES
jgi:hypothetical protein